MHTRTRTSAKSRRLVGRGGKVYIRDRNALHMQTFHRFPHFAEWMMENTYSLVCCDSSMCMNGGNQSLKPFLRIFNVIIVEDVEAVALFAFSVPMRC